MHRSIFLLFILGLAIVPWKLIDICVAHPSGHDHPHIFGKLTPCEVRAKEIRDTEETGIWPVMTCHTFIISVDDFQSPKESQFKIDEKQHVFPISNFQLVSLDYPREPNSMPPELHCRSATSIGSKLLRAPPVV